MTIGDHDLCCQGGDSSTFIYSSAVAHTWDPEGKIVDGSESGEGLGETADDDGVGFEERPQRRGVYVLSLALNVRVLVRESDLPVPRSHSVKPNFHYASWFGAGSEPASIVEFGREPASSC